MSVSQFARLRRLACEVLELQSETDDEVDVYRLTAATAALERDLEYVRSVLAGGAR